MKNYKIGIPAWKTGENSFGVTLSYLNFITKFLGDPVIITPYSDFDESIDLLIVPGGPDVDPSRYNEVPNFYTGKACPFREYFDVNILPKYIDNNTPIYGICRGEQSVAVLFGGKLTQDMFHPTNKAHDRSELVHSVIIDPTYRNTISNNIGANVPHTYKTNSIHHQVVDGASLRDTNLVVIGTSKEGGDVELIAHKTKPIVLEQAHPEETHHSLAINIIRYLLKTRESIIK